MAKKASANIRRYTAPNAPVISSVSRRVIE